MTSMGHLSQRHFFGSKNPLTKLLPYKKTIDDHKLFYAKGEDEIHKTLMTTYYVITNDGVKNVDLREQRDYWFVDSKRLYVTYRVVNPNQAVLRHVDSSHNAFQLLRKEIAKYSANSKLYDNFIGYIESEYGLCITEIFCEDK